MLVATASSHREAAFAAAEFLMDYLKTRAPFWKQVEKADEKSWVDAKSRRRYGGRALVCFTLADVRRRNENADVPESNMFPIVVAAIALVAFGVRTASAAEVTYFEVPRGAHPHDVAPAPDGDHLVHRAIAGRDWHSQS